MRGTGERNERTQFNRIKETFDRVLNEDITLGERINTIFREQGITVVSILTTISLAISTIVASIVASVRPIPIPPTPVPPHPAAAA